MNKPSSTLLGLLHFHGSPDSYLASLILFNSFMSTFPGFMSTFPEFLLVAQVAGSDWLSRSGKGDDALNLPQKIPSLQWIFQLARPGKDLVSHEARIVCHSSASGYGTYRMGHTDRS